MREGKKSSITASFFQLALLGFLSLFLFPSFVSGQEAPQLSQRWICLHAAQCNRPESQCVVNKGHRAKLTNEAGAYALPNKDTYVLECFTLDKYGPVCTTGNATVDQKNNFITCEPDNPDVCYTNLALLRNNLKYQFEGIFKQDGTPGVNPVKSDAQGNVGPVEWQSAGETIDRYFLAMNYFETTTTSGSVGGQQQGTFTFQTAAQNCTVIRWDPFGRVFDSQSLEPIAGVKVTLSKKRDNGQFTVVDPSEVTGGNFRNPYQTREDGVFTFLVDDGTYKLKPEIDSHTFPSDPSKLNSNYTLAYFDIYPSQTGEEIVQQGAIQHRDIPVDPTGEPYRSEVKLMSKPVQFLDKLTNTLKLELRVSHPLSKVDVYAKRPQGPDFIRSRLLYSGQADKEGKFEVVIDLDKLEQDEVVGDIEVTKTDLTQSQAQTRNGFIHQVFGWIKRVLKPEGVKAQVSNSTQITIDPVLNYVEGYAKDEAGNILKNTKVGVYLTFSNKPYYETKTDDKGYFKISSEYLPFMPYHFVFTTTKGRKIVKNTSEFIHNNKEFNAENNVNPNKFKDKFGVEPTVALAKKPTSSTGPSVGSEEKVSPIITEPPSSSIGQGQTLIVVLVLLLVLVGGAIIVLAVQISRKKQEEIE